MAELITLDLGLLDEFCGHFWMLHFYGFFTADIKFFMMFRFSLVYAAVFGSRNISS